MIRRTIISFAVSISLSGCGATDYLDQRAAALETQKTISENGKISDTNKAIYIERPPVSLNAKEEQNRPWWSNKRASIKGQGIPIDFAVKNIFRSAGQNVPVEYGPDVSPQKIISVDYSGDIYGALNEIGAKSDYSVTISNNKVRFDKYVTKVFEVNALIGKGSFLFGSKSGSNQTSGDGLATVNVTSSLSTNDTYSNIEITGLSAFDDFLSAIKAILKKDANKDKEKENLDGDVIVTESTASILVRTTPSRMSLVETYISSRKESIARQAMIEVKVLQFTGNKGSEYGIDWNVVRAFSDGKLSFSGPSLPTLGETGDYGFSFTSTSSKWDGTTILMKALQTQGEVGVEYEPRTTVRNNRVAKIDNSEKITYISKVKVTPNQNADASVEVVDAVVPDGLIMSVMPNISDDRVNLQISGVLSKVTGWRDTEVSGVTVRSPKVLEIKFDQDVGLKYGETLVLNGYKQKANKAEENSFFKVPFLGGNSGSTNTTETIVLITPKRI
ncbi:type II secretion system protein GspD [Aeromonas veronii]